MSPISQIATIGTQISEAFAGLDRIREMLELPTEGEDHRLREPVQELRGEVSFEDVWFEYEEGVPVLRDVSFPPPGRPTTSR
jgi:ABC-type multidrug transport system fused ATPase/permease subunit